MDKCISEGWWWYSETSEITVLCSKQTQRYFWSVLSCSKNSLFRAYCMTMFAFQLWGKYTQTSMKRLRAAYNNTYQFMHYIPRNISVHPHQVNHCVRSFDALLRNNFYQIFMRCASSSNFFFVRFKCLMLFTNLHFSSIIQSSCMMETSCSSCWCIVSVFTSHQYCFCVVKEKMYV